MRSISNIIALLVISFSAFSLDAFVPTNHATYASNKPQYVGELGEKWQFPSDHLPRGMRIGSFNISFWNILNKNYLFHIEANTQGLRDSSIMKDNIPIDNLGTLTIRELSTIEIAFGMINHPTNPRSLIALQETHSDVLSYLTASLPVDWKIILPSNTSYLQDVFLYDSTVFDFVNTHAVKYPGFEKTIFSLTLRHIESNNQYRFVQSHIPGGPNSGGECAKFAQEAMNQYDPAITTVLMGDMNQSPKTIQKALVDAAANAEIADLPYQYVSMDYPSHIDTRLCASWIDNFFIYSAHEGDVIEGSSPEEVEDRIVPFVNLITFMHAQGK